MPSTASVSPRPLGMIILPPGTTIGTATLESTDALTGHARFWLGFGSIFLAC